MSTEQALAGVYGTVLAVEIVLLFVGVFFTSVLVYSKTLACRELAFASMVVCAFSAGCSALLMSYRVTLLEVLSLGSSFCMTLISMVHLAQMSKER